jgi:hypothetical protein
MGNALDHNGVVHDDRSICGLRQALGYLCGFLERCRLLGPSISTAVGVSSAAVAVAVTLGKGGREAKERGEGDK